MEKQQKSNKSNDIKLLFDLAADKTREPLVPLLNKFEILKYSG